MQCASRQLAGQVPLVIGRSPLVALRLAPICRKLRRSCDRAVGGLLPAEPLFGVGSAEVGRADSREPDAHLTDRVAFEHDIAARSRDGPVTSASFDLLIRA